MIQINDHIQIRKELLEDYTKLVKYELIRDIWNKAQKIIDERGQFFYIDLLQILQDIKREAENNG